MSGFSRPLLRKPIGSHVSPPPPVRHAPHHKFSRHTCTLSSTLITHIITGTLNTNMVIMCTLHRHHKFTHHTIWYTHHIIPQLPHHTTQMVLLPVYSTHQKVWHSFAETTSIAVPLCRYRRSSGRSTSKAAPHLWNLCVMNPGFLEEAFQFAAQLCHKHTFRKKNTLKFGIIFWRVP